MHMGYVHGRSPVGDLLSLTTIRNVLGDAAAGGGSGRGLENAVGLVLYFQSREDL